jgi:peptide/nickel transport system substrate-binding protein
VPGTGPYMIARNQPKGFFILVRNPYFRQWSYAAQPVGYPSVIRYKRVATSKQESAVIANQADLAQVGDRSLATRYPTRVYSSLRIGTSYAFLNNRQPPFANIEARQAVNYAIDRARILRLFDFAPGQAAPTCQILPADFPGHKSYCPYTSGTKNGVWHGPDMRKALRLAKASGTTNMPVTVWSPNDSTGRAVGSYLVQVLKDLGYHARLHAVPALRFFTDAGNTRNKIQIGIGGGWSPDFPAPSAFFLPLLGCRALSEHANNTTNWARFCDPHFDNLVREAQATQLTDPAAARRLWARVDRIATNNALYVPLYNESSAVAFVSSRVGNYQASPIYGPLLDQMWVR